MTNDGSIIARGSGFTTYALELENDGLKYLVGFVQPNGNAKEFIEPEQQFAVVMINQVLVLWIVTLVKKSIISLMFI